MTDAPSFPPLEPTSGERPAQSLPFAREAEEAVLGAILVNPEVYYDVAATAGSGRPSTACTTNVSRSTC